MSNSIRQGFFEDHTTDDFNTFMRKVIEGMRKGMMETEPSELRVGADSSSTVDNSEHDIIDLDKSE